MQPTGSLGDSDDPASLRAAASAAGWWSAAAGKGSRWLGWRLRLLFAAALLACAAVAWLAQALAAQSRLDATWRSNADGRIELATSRDPSLAAHRGSVVESVAAGGREIRLSDSLALHRSTRWIVDDVQRRRHPSLQAALAEALESERLWLTFADGSRVQVASARTGVLGLPAMFWLFSALAIVLCMAGTVFVLANPCAPALLYASMSWCQAGNLIFIAIESTAELGLPAWLSQLNLPLRQAFDLTTAAAFVHLACIRPSRLPAAQPIVTATWCSAIFIAFAAANDSLADAWWWTQFAVALGGAVAIGVLGWSHSIRPHPYAMVLRRFAIVAVGTWLLLTVAIGATARLPGAPYLVVAVGPTLWYVFLASLLLLVPLLSKSQPMIREFSMLAAISTIATSLDLLFAAFFSFGPFTSLTLAVFLSLAVYAGARQWILDRLLGNAVLTTERTFEHLYRTVREVERHPERAAALLGDLLRRLFEPVELRLIDGCREYPVVVPDGAEMIVPLPALGGEAATQSLLLRFAHHGRHLFTRDDARLAERIVEQLQRAVRFDRAVAQGRSQERRRLAQDLHDDIGARLLTLICEAPTPEMAEYARHTLQDLKTLTRGMAAMNRRLADAADEWRADIEPRLAAARIALAWRATFDTDPLLGVVQWSSLTRILRELVSNAIAHSRASKLEIDIALAADRLRIVVVDDGIGKAPAQWSHGLGLGGVRKRIRQLSGEVHWSENAGGGIRCEVTVGKLSTSEPESAI